MIHKPLDDYKLGIEADKEIKRKAQDYKIKKGRQKEIEKERKKEQKSNLQKRQRKKEIKEEMLKEEEKSNHYTVK